jgi:hypothetical protein
MMGAMIATQLLARVGHIRVYAAVRCDVLRCRRWRCISAPIWVWGVTRMAAGVSVALMFAVIESWISFSIGTRVRGEVMSVYMVLTKGAFALGPFFAFNYAPIAAEPWMIAAALAALSMLPICFTAAEQPDPPKAQPLALVEQFATAPAAVIGSFGAGLVNGGVLALAPLYAAQHYGDNAAAEFYSAAFVGSLLLQWPAGRLSDRVDRRLVIAGLAVSPQSPRSRWRSGAGNCCIGRRRCSSLSGARARSASTASRLRTWLIAPSPANSRNRRRACCSCGRRLGDRAVASWGRWSIGSMSRACSGLRAPLACCVRGHVLAAHDARALNHQGRVRAAARHQRRRRRDRLRRGQSAARSIRARLRAPINPAKQTKREARSPADRRLAQASRDAAWVRT